MKFDKNQLISFILFVAIILTAIFLGVFKQVTLVLSANFVSIWPIFIFLLIFTITQLLRAKRLHLLTDRKIKYSSFIPLVYIAWMLNVLFPARLGEVSQIYLLNKKGISRADALLIIIIDKLLDLIALLIVITVVILSIGYEFLDTISSFNIVILLGLIVIGIVVFLLILYLRVEFYIFFIKTIFGLFKLHKIEKRIIEILYRLNEAFSQVIHRPYSFISALIIAFVVWGLEMTSVYVIAKSIGLDLPIFLAFLAQLITFISMIVPITPGGFGTYELILGFSLSVFTNLSFKQLTLPLAIIEHGLRQIYSVIAGLLFLNTFNLTEFRIFRESSDQNVDD